MFVKKYEAPSLESALSLIKSELGPNALILSTKHFPKSFMKRAMVEVTAAYEKTEIGDIEIPEDTFQNWIKTSHKEKKAAPRKQVETRESAEPLTQRFHAPQGKLLQEEILLDLGFSPESARSLGIQLTSDFLKRDLENPLLRLKSQQKLVVQALRTVTPQMFETRKSWVVLGQPGSGRTSLVVKLGLFLKSIGRKPCLVSKEDRKIFGKNELASYAKLIRVPFQQSSNAIELIDGVNLPRTKNERIELSKDQAVILVVDASMRLLEIQRLIDQAQEYDPKAMVFTKLDLVSQRGIIYDILKYSKIPLLGITRSSSYKVPFQFFETKELAEFILKG